MADPGAAVPPDRPASPDGDALRECLAGVTAVFASAERDSGQVDVQLAQLRELLEAHFADEEREDGQFEEAIFRAPWLTGEAQRLRREHEALLRSLASVQNHAAQSQAREPGADASEPFAAFAERLLEHEADEHNLLREAFQARWPE